MEESLEARITCLENTLGTNEKVDCRAGDLDITSLQEKMVEKGMNRVLKVPIQSLKKLHELTNKVDSRPIAEKVNMVEFCEDLIRQRADLLQEMEERLQVVLKCDNIAAVPNHEPAVTAITEEIQTALKIWKEHSVDLNAFKTEYFSLFSALQAHINEIEARVIAAEAAAAK